MGRYARLDITDEVSDNSVRRDVKFTGCIADAAHLIGVDCGSEAIELSRDQVQEVIGVMMTAAKNCRSFDRYFAWQLSHMSMWWASAQDGQTMVFA